MLKIIKSLKVLALTTIRYNVVEVVAKSSIKSNLSKFKKIKITTLKGPIILSTIKATKFLTSEARVVFIKLRQAFIKTPSLRYFDPKYYI